MTEESKSKWDWAPIVIIVAGPFVAGSSMLLGATLVMSGLGGLLIRKHEKIDGGAVFVVFLMAWMALMLGAMLNADEKVGQAYSAHRAMLRCTEADQWVRTNGEYTRSGRQPTAEDLERCEVDHSEAGRDFRVMLEINGWSPSLSLPWTKHRSKRDWGPQFARGERRSK